MAKNKLEKMESFTEAYSKIKAGKPFVVKENNGGKLERVKVLYEMEPRKISEAVSLYEQENVFTFVYSIAAALGIKKIKMNAVGEDDDKLTFVCDKAAEAEKLGDLLSKTLKNLKQIDVDDEGESAEAMTFAEIIKNVSVDDTNVNLEV